MKKAKMKSEPLFQGNLSGKRLDLHLMTERLDASLCDDFKEQCANYFSNPISEIQMNMEQVGFIDSSGIGLLLNLYKRLDGEQKAFRLSKVQPNVRSVIEMLRLQRVFEME
jgi:anti-anti-sigma factor